LKTKTPDLVISGKRDRLHWDPIRERFRNDDEGNAMLSRLMRAPYILDL
jgi:hypothetical protein